MNSRKRLPPSVQPPAELQPPRPPESMRPPGPARSQGDLGSAVAPAGRRGGLGFGLALACGLSLVTALSSCAPAGNRADEPAAGDRGGLSWLLEGRARADVPPGSRGRPRPSIVWTPVKPLEPELVLAKPAGPPMSLTSSDGTGLQLVALEARAVVEDPLTFTELKLTFRNPQPRQLEGQFEITLPPDAAISRFAMRQGDAWQEGEVVELQAARQAYEDFLHRRQDPALLEKQAGNQFRARVFPIPPSGEKELIISYSAERVRDSEPYRIYLRGLPKLERLDIRALVARDVGGGVQSSLGGVSLVHQTVAVQKSDWTPDNDFEVAVPVPQVSQSGKGGAVGLRHQNLLLARISPTELITASQTDPLDSLLVLFDTSASRALGFAAQVSALGELVAALKQQAGPALPLRVLAFDQDVEEIFSGSAGDFGKAQLDKLSQRQALGASDLGRALTAAAQKGGSYHRALLITDGVVTAGQAEATELKPLVQALGGFGVRRLDVVAFGGIRDDGLLGKLTSAGLPSDGLVLEGEMGAAALVRKIERGVHSGIAVSVPGSQWVWPLTLDAMQPGDQALVYADLPADKPFEVVLTDRQQRQQRVSVTTVEVARPLLERSWIGARIQRLSHQRDTVAVRQGAGRANQHAEAVYGGTRQVQGRGDPVARSRARPLGIGRGRIRGSRIQELIRRFRKGLRKRLRNRLRRGPCRRLRIRQIRRIRRLRRRQTEPLLRARQVLVQLGQRIAQRLQLRFRFRFQFRFPSGRRAACARPLLVSHDPSPPASGSGWRTS